MLKDHCTSNQCYPGAMRRVAYYLWLYDWEGMRVRTTWKLPADIATSWRADATPDESTLEWREFPETADDHKILAAKLRGGSSP